jgi:hypothetical protein
VNDPTGGELNVKVAEFLDDVSVHLGVDAAGVARRIVGWARRRGLIDRVWNPNPTKGLAFAPTVPGLAGWGSAPIVVWSRSDEGLVVELGHLPHKPPFDDPERIEALSAQPYAVEGAVWQPKPQFPSIALDELARGVVLDRVLRVIDEVVTQLEAPQEGTESVP